MSITQKHIISLFFLIALVSLLPIAIFLVGKRQDIRPRALQGYANFQLSADTQNAQTGQVVNVLSSLLLTQSNLRVSGVDFILLYEKDKFDVISVTPVTIKEDPAAGFTDSVIAVADGSFDAKFNFLRVVLTSNKPANQLAGGPVQLAKIAFRAGSDGQGIIKYPDDNKYLQVVGATYVPTGTPAPSFTPTPTGGVPTVSISPTLSASPSGSLTPAPVTVFDNFDGASLDTTKWEVSSSTPNATVTQENGVVSIVIPQSTTITTQWANVHLKKPIQGNFTIEAEFQSVDTEGNKANGSQFLSLSNFSGSELLRIERYAVGVLQSFSRASPNAAVETPPNHTGITGSVKVKVERVGNIGRTWYDVGSGYVLDKEFASVYTGVGSVEMAAINLDTFPKVEAKFDNFTGKVNWAN